MPRACWSRLPPTCFRWRFSNPPASGAPTSPSARPNVWAPRWGSAAPSAGYMATREAFKRNMPGRIIGVSVDRLGNRALRMALQMREQHIKRERATSNICTASALMASMAGFYCVYNGPEGLKRACRHGPSGRRNGRRRTPSDGLQTRRRRLFRHARSLAEAAVVQSLALENGINFFYPPKAPCACRSTKSPLPKRSPR